MEGTLHVLLVEDNPDDAELILRELRKSNGYRILSERVETEEQLKAAFHDQAWDIIICDFSMPRLDAPRVLELMDGYGLTTPFILVSGKIADDDVEKVLGHKSVHEFLPKESLSKIGHMLHRALRLSVGYDGMLEGWSRALELRDPETLGHSKRVVELTLRLARRMGVGETEITHIRRGALMHDVGKMGIPDSVLLKQGPLTDAEMRIMRRHPKIGYDLLSRIEFMKHSLFIPYCHHERWDGSGYPRGLKGEEIHLRARVFAVVDVYDAMISDRPYREGMLVPVVLKYIQAQSGILFDPAVVTVFLETMGG